MGLLLCYCFTLTRALRRECTLLEDFFSLKKLVLGSSLDEFFLFFIVMLRFVGKTQAHSGLASNISVLVLVDDAYS